MGHGASLGKKMVLNVLIFLLAAASGAENECNFSRDCQELRRCKNIADAGCVCNFGKCIIDGNPFFRGSECTKYTDCDCKNNKESCFCRGGFCRETKCESDCATDSDCKDFHCNRALGYTCKCENSLCAYKKKTAECKSIVDCIDKGKCTADKPCACTQEFCTLPWWVAESSLEINCRSDQDCEETIANCRGDKCVCGNMKNINDWEIRGTCGTRTKPKKKKEEEKRKTNNDAIVFQ